MARTLLVVQCGGPTAVINASLAAVIAAAQRDAAVSRIVGCRRGWAGLAQGDWVDLTALTPAHLATLRLQPGYDHSYYFIASFIGEHVAHHAAALRRGG